MSPVEMNERVDTFTSLVQFRTSLIHEMLASLHTLVARRRLIPWVDRAKAMFDKSFWVELDALYRPFEDGALFFELPVGFSNNHDIPGFIQYVRDMRPATFVFYFIGRVIPLADLERHDLDRKYIVDNVNRFFDLRKHSPCTYVDTLDVLLDDIPDFQARLTRLWEHYWHTFFQGQVSELSERWTAAIDDKQHILTHRGGEALLEVVTGRAHIPDPLPPDHPVREITFIPLYFGTAASYMFYGYGNVTLLFNSEATQARLSAIEQGKNEALDVARILGDDTRLAILKLISQHRGSINGKKIAERLGLSPSTVSRQLTQLRDSGLVIEEKQDDQSINYRLVPEVITELPKKLLDYLYEG